MFILPFTIATGTSSGKSNAGKGSGAFILADMDLGATASTTDSNVASIGSIFSGVLAIDQFPVGEPLLDHPVNRHADEIQRANLRSVVAERELVHIAVQVLGAHVVIDAVVAALQQRPEAFDAVSVGFVADVLTYRVVDALVRETLAGKTIVATMHVRHDSCTFGCIGGDESLKGGASRPLRRYSAHLTVLIADTNNSGFAYCATPSVQLLVRVLVLLFAADIGFINLGVIAHVVVALIFQPRFTDALSKKPSCFLGDAKFAGHLSTGDTLAGTGKHVDRQQPLEQGKAAFSQNRACAHAEMLATVLAAVGHRLVVFAFGDRYAATVPANRLIRPPARLEELARGFLVRELLEELKSGKRFGV